MKSIISIVFFLTSLLSCSILNAQIPLEVSTQVLYPYPTQYAVWLSESESFSVTVINNSDSEFTFFIRTELEGSDYNLNETYIRISPDYRPISGFTLSPGEAHTYNSSDIQASFANLSQADIEISDNIPIGDINGELPTGEYRICTQVVEFNDDPSVEPALLSPIDCSDYFSVGQASVQLEFPNEFQSLRPDFPETFQWTVTGIDINDVNNYLYQLKIYEIDSIQAAEESPYDLVEEGFANVIYTSEPTSELLDVFDPTQGSIPLIYGNTYAAQVTVVETNGIYFDNNNKSNINIYSCIEPDDYSPTTDPVTQNQMDCFEHCNYILDDNTTLLSDPSPSVIEVGHFTMDQVEITSQNNGLYSGTGRIQIEWLNNVYVKTTFNNIKVNSDGRMIDGVVMGDKAPIQPSMLEEFNNALRTTRMAFGLFGSDATIDLPIGINQNILGHNFLVALTDLTFTPTTANVNTACNFHIPSMGEDTWVSLESTETCMHPGGFGNEFVLHMGYDQTILGQGDITFKLNGSSAVSSDEVKQEATYLEMDCNGIKSFSLKGEVYFPESLLVKENEDGSIDHSDDIDAENRVVGKLNFTIDKQTGEDGNVYALYGEEGIPEENGLHFIASIGIENPFQIKGVEGWGLEVQEMWLDASDVQNPPDIEFPDSFIFDGGDDGEVDATWTGFYMKRLQMKTPKEFVKGNQRQGFEIANIIIDPTITMSISALGVLGINAGEIDKWSFEISKLTINIVQGAFVSGGMEGKIGLPIAEEGTFIDYSAMIMDSEPNDSEVNKLEYVFTVNPSDDFNVPLLLASVNLDEASYLKGGFVPGKENESFFELYAAGGLSFNSDLFEEEDGGKPLPLNSPWVSFDLKYHSKNGFTKSNFGFLGDFEFEQTDFYTDFSGPSSETGSGYDSGEFNKESFVGFPLTITEMDITNLNLSTGEFVFNIVPSITLTPGESGIAANTTLAIKSKLNYTASGNRLTYEGLDVPRVEVDAEIGGCYVQGEIEFYNTQGNGVGAKGVKGDVAVMLPMGIGMKMAADFGTIVEDKNAAYNTEKNFPYFYVDGMVYFGDNGGLPVGGAIAIYGVGGGLSYNMSRSSYAGDDAAIASLLETANSGPSSNPDDLYANEVRTTGIVPSPDFGTYGLKLAATLGTFPISSLLNADISIEGEFEVDRGITYMALRGNGFMMTPISNRNNPMAEVEVNIEYDNPFPGDYSISGDLTLWVNILDVLYGSGANNKVGKAVFYADNGIKNSPSTWYLHLGNPDDRMGFMLGIAGLITANAEGYFMLGHGLPTSLPIPEAVEDLFGYSNSSDKGRLTSGTINGEVDREADDIQDAADGTGFALGAEVAVSININEFGIYSKLGIFLGFDVNVTHSTSRTCYISGQGDFAPGANGWYGSGQIYAGLEGALGFYVKAFGKEHNFKLFALKAAMMLSGGGPNPFWAEGRAGIYISVLNGLVKCNKSISIRAGEKCIPSYDDPFGGIPLIVEHWPENNEKKQSTWTKPKISFTFPMNELLTIPSLDEDGNSYNEYITQSFINLSFRERDSQVEVPTQGIFWSDGNKQLEIKPSGNLASKTWYEVSLRLIAYDQNGARIYVDGKKWYQDTTFTFKTGKLSSLDDVISTSIPIRNQRHFVQNDVWSALGSTGLASISFDIGANQEDYFLLEDDDKTYEYYMRFVPMSGGDIKEVGLNLFGSNPVTKMTYYLPVLENNKIYAAQLIQKFTYKNRLQPTAQTIEPLIFSLNNSSAATNEISSETEINFQNQKINPAEDMGWNEKSMITYFFKTSKYNTYDEKFAGVSLSFSKYGPTGELNNMLSLGMDEFLDEFDVHGETWNGSLTMDPLIKIYDPIHFRSTDGNNFALGYTTFYESVIQDMFVDLAESYDTKWGYPNPEKPIEWPIEDLHFDYLNPLELRMTKQVQNYDPPLSESDIDASWATSLYGNNFISILNDASNIIGPIGNSNNLDIHIPLWDKIGEDKFVIIDWAASVKATKTYITFGQNTNLLLLYDYGEWIDENYHKFNNLTEDIQHTFVSPLGFPGKYRLQLYKDIFWKTNSDEAQFGKSARGEVFKTINYSVD